MRVMYEGVAGLDVHKSLLGPALPRAIIIRVVKNATQAG